MICRSVSHVHYTFDQRNVVKFIRNFCWTCHDSSIYCQTGPIKPMGTMHEAAGVLGASDTSRKHVSKVTRGEQRRRPAVPYAEDLSSLSSRRELDARRCLAVCPDISTVRSPAETLGSRGFGETTAQIAVSPCLPSLPSACPHACPPFSPISVSRTPPRSRPPRCLIRWLAETCSAAAAPAPARSCSRTSARPAAASPKTPWWSPPDWRLWGCSCRGDRGGRKASLLLIPRGWSIGRVAREASPTASSLFSWSPARPRGSPCQPTR